MVPIFGGHRVYELSLSLIFGPWFNHHTAPLQRVCYVSDKELRSTTDAWRSMGCEINEDLSAGFDRNVSGAFAVFSERLNICDWTVKTNTTSRPASIVSDCLPAIPHLYISAFLYLSSSSSSS